MLWGFYFNEGLGKLRIDWKIDEAKYKEAVKKRLENGGEGHLTVTEYLNLQLQKSAKWS